MPPSTKANKLRSCNIQPELSSLPCHEPCQVQLSPTSNAQLRNSLAKIRQTATM